MTSSAYGSVEALGGLGSSESVRRSSIRSSTGKRNTESHSISFKNIESTRDYSNNEDDGSSSQPLLEPPRLVERNLAFDQSKNRINVFHNKGWEISRLVRHDWFHVFLRQSTWVSVPLLIALWTAMICIFAACYVAIDSVHPNISCGLGAEGEPITFGPAFAFSLETCTTVGYGLPNSVNSFFETNCGGLQAMIYFQMLWSMMFNAFLFAFFYNRLGRCESRATQVVFTSKALVSIAQNGQVRFQVRLFDVDARYPVVEAHVRVYAVRKVRPVPRLLRTLQPNDDMGGVLFLSLPSVVAHHIDIYSILHPPVETTLDPRGLDLRQVDSHTNSREEIVCPICSESYGTHERWVRHVKYQRLVEEKDEYPVEGTHLSLTEADLQPPIYPTTDLDELRDYFKEEISEIICVVEGIDPLISGTFQALQSYTFEDIVWEENATFAPCLQVKGKNISIDLDKFHDIEVLPENVQDFKRRQLQHRSIRAQDSLYIACSDNTKS